MPLLLWAAKTGTSFTTLKHKGDFLSFIKTTIKTPHYNPELNVVCSFSPALAALQVQDKWS